MASTTGVGRNIIVGAQMLFVAFGALVLVPLLTGLDPSIALFSAGIGTLIFQLITKSKVPVFLASSFAFIAPIQVGIDMYGIAATLGGLACAGIFYLLLGGLVKWQGVKVIERYLPPIVTGPVIMVIGLQLAPVAIDMTRNFAGQEGTNSLALLIAFISLATTIFIVMKGKGILSLIPIIVGIIVGYVISIFFGVVDYSAIHEAAWFHIPWVTAMREGSFAFPVFELGAILFILPVAIAPAIEHVGDILAISAVTEHDYIEDPGLHRTLSGDGVATTIGALLGGPPNTTYSEVTGAVALLKTFDPMLMRIAAIFAILLAFVGKLGAILKSIPVPVMGGILILLFGMIAVIGMQTLIREKVDLGKSRNLVIAAVILITGIGDMAFNVGDFSLSGIGLAGVIGVLLNMILPQTQDDTQGKDTE